VSEDPGAPLWSGRFSKPPAPEAAALGRSLSFDVRLAPQDVESSVAHVRALEDAGLLDAGEAGMLEKALRDVGAEIAAGAFAFDPADEDVHSAIERAVTQRLGDVGAKLHAGRSRNDLVMTDLRLWLLDAHRRIEEGVLRLIRALADHARRHAETVMPGTTHARSAQPVTLGHHLLAYVEMLGRDRGRLGDCRRRLNECPLGAAALAGTSFPIDRRMTAAALGFERPAANSLDAVSDRDFAIEFLAAGALLAVHLSRLGEEIVVWASAQFGFIVLPDAFSTGSSIMPQKRNPDAAELVRAKAGRVIGALMSLLTVLKGLPLAYAKDMQEDKEPVFDAADTLLLCVRAMTGMIEGAVFDRDRMRAAAGRGFSTATDLADWLVRVKGVPFRRAHHVVGALVKAAEDKGGGLEDLSLAEMQAVEPALTEDVFAVLSVESSVESRTSEGGTAPARVRAAVAEARRRFL
jgi:argininosuccinate lyase